MSTIEPGKQPSEATSHPEVRAESLQASQVPSEGPQLGKGVSLFSRFIWIISFAWVKASFSNWSEKQRLTGSLARTLVDTVDIPKPQAKEVKRLALESHLDDLSLDQQHSLHSLLSEHKKITSALIFETAENRPKELHGLLKKLATPDGKMMIEQRERIAGAAEDNPIKGVNILSDTGVTNGVSLQGFHYEIHLGFKLPDPLTQKVSDFHGTVEIMVTNPETQQIRRLSTTLKILGEVNGVHILEELQKLENALHYPQYAPAEYARLADQAQEALSQSGFQNIQTPDQYVKAYKQGNVHLSGGEPSLFYPLEPPILHSGSISPREVEKAQNILFGEKLEPADLPRLFIHTDTRGSTSEVGCAIDSRTIELGNQKYLELKLTTTCKGRDLTFTTRILYNEGERKGELIGRIREDGSLARAMLMASASFTREFVP